VSAGQAAVKVKFDEASPAGARAKKRERKRECRWRDGDGEREGGGGGGGKTQRHATGEVSICVGPAAQSGGVYNFAPFLRKAKRRRSLDSLHQRPGMPGHGCATAAPADRGRGHWQNSARRGRTRARELPRRKALGPRRWGFAHHDEHITLPAFFEKL
jgi:hypothetical protein